MSFVLCALCFVVGRRIRTGAKRPIDQDNQSGSDSVRSIGRFAPVLIRGQSYKAKDKVQSTKRPNTKY